MCRGRGVALINLRATLQHYTRGSEAVVMVKREERDVVLLHRRGKCIDVAFPEDDELTGEDWYYAREAAFAQLRKFKGIPHELVDLVEGFQDHTVVQPFFYRPSDRVALRFGVRVKKSKPDIQRLKDSLAAYYRAQKEKRPWTASEALALVLRLSLRALKAAEKTRRAAPVRTLKFVPRSLIARIAMYLLDGCVQESCPPGPRLNDLLRELLDTENIKHSVMHHKDDQKFLSFAAYAIAQLPAPTHICGMTDGIVRNSPLGRRRAPTGGSQMPKHDPPGDDAALLELERELIGLDRAIRAADENREAINYTLFDRRDELMARIFNTPAAGLAGLAVQARSYLSEREDEFADSEAEEPLDFTHMGAVLAHGILALAGGPDAWRDITKGGKPTR
jgi:hypothetical protein